jgi:hypothetical protein
MMSKLLITLTVAVLALTLSEVAAAADKDQNSPQIQAQQVADPAAGGAVASQREWEYLTALQKCELRTGAERTKCVDAVRNKYGQM